MDLELIPPGRPGEDLGVAHLLKHWLNPSSGTNFSIPKMPKI